MFNLHHVCNQYFLEHLVLIFVCRETKCGCHHITFVEPARRQIAQHGAHILVFEPSALADCTPKASPWRTTFKIFVSIITKNVV